jgi:predicted nucleic acid-binding Zn ribbon protein
MAYLKPKPKCLKCGKRRATFGQKFCSEQCGLHYALDRSVDWHACWVCWKWASEGGWVGETFLCQAHLEDEFTRAQILQQQQDEKDAIK